MIELDAELLQYEVAGAWWPSFIPWGWAQTLVAKYFVWKARRKYRRYEVFVRRRTILVYAYAEEEVERDRTA